MIEKADIDQLQRRPEPACDCRISLGRLCTATGMVVGDDDGGGVVAQSRFDDFARVDAGLINRAAKQDFVGYRCCLNILF